MHTLHTPVADGTGAIRRIATSGLPLYSREGKVRTLIDSLRATIKRPRVDDTAALQPLYRHAPGKQSSHPDRLATDSFTARLLPQADPSQTPFPIWRSPETYAQRFLEWLADHRPGEVLAREVQGAFREMCSDIGWEPAAWNRVAPRFRELINDRKHYHDIVVNGRRHRWCFYSLPCRLADDSLAARDRLAADREPVAA